MSNPSRPRQGSGRDEPDEWLLDAARRAGHRLPDGDRPAGTSAWRVLLTAGLPEEEVLRLACAGSGTEPADFSSLSPALGALLDHGIALKYRIVPLGVHAGALAVATSNPRNAALERDLALAARQRVRLCAASPTDVIRAQGVVYGGGVYGTRGDASVSAPLHAPAPPSATQPRRAPVARMSLSMAAPTDPDGLPIDAVDTDALLVTHDAASQLSAVAGHEVTHEAQVEPHDEQPAQPEAAPAPAPVPDLAERLLATACGEHASEAILEPTGDGGLLVRLCVDGTLNDRYRIPAAQSERLLHALKRRARLDVAVTAHPQQGRISFESATGTISVRVSTEPLGGDVERVVLRLFASGELRGLNELGFAEGEERRLGELLAARSGIVVIAGPAGAGKTTTMYAAARSLRSDGRAVSTVEQLIEYPLERVTQTQLSGARVTLASAVRGVLAAEGDVVIVGAPLDGPTLVQGDTGARRTRLVLVSLDTADMPSTLARLQELHPARARLAETLRGVVVQRLVRRLCPACAAPQVVGELPEQQQRLLAGLPTEKMRGPVGCDDCRTTGYLGRVAIAEVVPVTAKLRQAFVRGADAAELAKVAGEQGMKTLWDSGLLRVLEGITSLGELLDAVNPPAAGGTEPQEDIDALLTQLLGEPNMQPASLLPERIVTPAASTAPVSRTLRESPVASFTLVGHESPVAMPVVRPTLLRPGPARTTLPPTAAVSPSAPAAEVARAPGVLRVLLVNDDVVARRALGQALTAAGVQVMQVSDGAQAVMYVRRLLPDVVLTEVALPGLDAIGILGALAGAAAPPVVVYTEQADDALDAWLHEAGARAVLRHDLPVAELVARLRAEAGREPA